MKSRLGIFLTLIFLGLTISPPPVLALKKRVAKTTITKRTTTASKPAGVAYSRAKLSRPTNSVQVTFMNLDQVSSIDYLLTYRGNGLNQGAGGTVRPSGAGTEARDLYFGTCSHGVCTPHSGISGATLLVTTNLKSGAIHVKRYRIKI